MCTKVTDMTDNIYKLNIPFLHRWKGKRCPCLLPAAPDEDISKDLCPCDNFTLNHQCRCKLFVKQDEEKDTIPGSNSERL
jgi:ferredoxin-thioredoxin reductase catalytic subunit